LKAHGLYERWLEAYLAALYTHPTDGLVLTFAREALQMGAAHWPEDDVVNALHHVCSIPIDFPTKTNLQTTVLQLRPRPTVADLEGSDNQLLAGKPENPFGNTLEAKRNRN